MQQITVLNPVIERAFTSVSDMLGTGIYVVNLAKSVISNPFVMGFNYGMSFFGNNQGTYLIDVYTPHLANNVEGMKFDSSDMPGAYRNFIKIFGGSIQYNTSYGTAGTKLVDVAGTNTHTIQNGIQFYGTSIEIGQNGKSIATGRLSSGDAIGTPQMAAQHRTWATVGILRL